MKKTPSPPPFPPKWPNILLAKNMRNVLKHVEKKIAFFYSFFRFTKFKFLVSGTWKRFLRTWFRNPNNQLGEGIQSTRFRGLGAKPLEHKIYIANFGTTLFSCSDFARDWVSEDTKRKYVRKTLSKKCLKFFFSAFFKFSETYADHCLNEIKAKQNYS